VINDFRTYHNNLYKVGHVFFTEGASDFQLLCRNLFYFRIFVGLFSVFPKIVCDQCVFGFVVWHSKISSSVLNSILGNCDKIFGKPSAMLYCNGNDRASNGKQIRYTVHQILKQLINICRNCSKMKTADFVRATVYMLDINYCYIFLFIDFESKRITVTVFL